MAIDNYSALQASIAGWTARADLAAIIPDFITLAEREISRTLRANVARAFLTLDAAVVPLPADVGELRSVRLSTDVNRGVLQSVSPEALADYAQVWSGASGVPHWYSTVNNSLLLIPSPDTEYVSEIIYFEKLVPLSEAEPSNSVLVNHPDVYLFGAMAQAEPYLEHDERAPMWQAKFEKAIDDANLARERAEYGSSPRPIRLPVVFG